LRSYKLRGCSLKTNPKLALCAFSDGFRLQVFAFGQGNVNHSTLLRSHRSKSKHRSGCSDLSRGVQGHCPQFELPSSAETVNVANDPLPGGKTSSKCLVDQVLQCFEQLSTFSLEQFRITAIQVQKAPICTLLSRDLKRKSGFLCDGLKKSPGSFTRFVHVY
jgi:hypothetical protein